MTDEQWCAAVVERLEHMHIRYFGIYKPTLAVKFDASKEFGVNFQSGDHRYAKRFPLKATIWEQAHAVREALAQGMAEARR